jgi:uncharacterized RDD family membrane protein YckC
VAETRPAVETPPWFAEPTFGQRLLAAVVDGLLLAAVAFGLERLLGGSTRLLGPLIVALYTVGTVAVTGRTVGKRLLGLRVADLATGTIPDLRAATVRWAVASAPALASLLLPARSPLARLLPLVTIAVYLGILRGPLHRGLHDHAAGTIVSAVPMGV